MHSPRWSSSQPQTLCHNPLIPSQPLNLPPVSYRILLSSIYDLNASGAAWHHVSKIDRYILFEIPVALAPLNFAFQPISRLIHHACQVCLFNPLKDKVGFHYTISCLPKMLLLSNFYFFSFIFFCRNAGVNAVCGCRCGWLEGCWMCSEASNWLSSPHVESPWFLRGNRHANNTGACAYISRRRCVPALGQYHYGNAAWILWVSLFELDNKAVQWAC